MMEPKNKLFDFARVQPKVDAVVLPVAGDAAPVKQGAGSPEFTDTIAFRSPVISVSEERLLAERLLLAGVGGAVSSAYKMLRTQVLRRMDQLGANTLAVLSPTEGAGKTLTAINLAISIAAETERTALLVDLDLRNPNIHRRFGFTPAMGVEHCLQSRHPAQDAMIKISGYERLTLLPAKSKVENSSELLTGQSTAQLVEELRTRYANRIIIFDLPPVLQADDALAFSRYIQCGLMVVNEGRTQREDVIRSIELLRDLKIVGTVLNGAREKVQSYY
jgi:protein-tyrosine kinase